MSDVSGLSDLSNEELVEVFQRSDDDGKRDVLEVLCRQNTGLVQTVAARYRGIAELDDIRQEGFTGLMKAAELYEPNKGAQFSTFAAIWIKSAILSYLRRLRGGSAVSLSISRYDEVLAYRQYCERFHAQYGRRPLDGELAAALGVSMYAIEKIREAERVCVTSSLSEPFGDLEGVTLEDAIPDDRDALGDLEEDIQHEELARALWSLVDSVLDPDEKAVVSARYVSRRTFKEIEAETKLQRAQALEMRALRKLRFSRGSKRLRSFLYIDGFKGTGLSAFRHSGTSATERTALMMLEQNTEES